LCGSKDQTEAVIGLAFINHCSDCTTMPLLYGMAKKSDYPENLKKFLVDFRHISCVAPWERKAEKMSRAE
jgi:hypothetical protein